MRPIPVLTPQQSRAWDDSSIASGRPTRLLMEQAGRAVAQLLLERFSGPARAGVLVAAGPGNNGGDGWVTARALHMVGIPVWVSESSAPDGDSLCAQVRAVAMSDGVRTVPSDGPWPNVGLFVDALLGTGARGAPRGEMASLIARMIDAERPIVAIDGPSGLDLANGMHYGLLQADLTVTFGGPRRGHLMARDEIGDLIVADIGLCDVDPAWPQLVDIHWAARRFQPLAANAYKGSRGRVVIVGGAPSMTGAARLCARSAFAAGAGLLHVVAPEASVAALRAAEPDVQTLAHEFTLPLHPELLELIDKADAVVIGPGLGRAPERTPFVLAVIAAARAAVIDADALVALKGERPALLALARDRAMVCTPHIGEFRTLFGDLAHDLETAPWEAASAAAVASGTTVLLKGVPTVIASPDGALLTVAAGNPGLATGGSGDLLSGLIAAILAQGTALPLAAALGAQALGDAADHAARRSTARAMRPMDVVLALPDVWRLWARLRGATSAQFPILLDLPRPRTT
jgi:ADP-dependent NAD(P)H-hydrate dehydratase / NAD(P)H-hydrate epimerase